MSPAKPFVAMDVQALQSLDLVMRSGLRGTHLLFSNLHIREAFTGEPQIEVAADRDLNERVQSAIADLLRCDDLGQRQAFIESLEPAVRALLVRIYFDFLDRYLPDERNPEVLH